MRRVPYWTVVVLCGATFGCALTRQTAPNELAYHGNVPVEIVNQTKSSITELQLHRGEKDVEYGGYRDSTPIHFDKSP